MTHFLCIGCATRNEAKTGIEKYGFVGKFDDFSGLNLERRVRTAYLQNQVR